MPRDTMKKPTHYQIQARRTALPPIASRIISLNIDGQILDSNVAQESFEPKQAAVSCSGTYKGTITTQFNMIRMIRRNYNYFQIKLSII